MAIDKSIGEVIHEHGLVVITDSTYATSLVSSNLEIDWKSVLPLFTTTFSCEIKDYEFNYTLNPTAIDSNGNLKSNVSGSEFSPYITTVGLYNDANELLAVGKLSIPLRKSNDTDMVIKIKLDF